MKGGFNMFKTNKKLKEDNKVLRSKLYNTRESYKSTLQTIQYRLAMAIEFTDLNDIVKNDIIQVGKLIELEKESIESDKRTKS
jgi:hypothetical protein